MANDATPTEIMPGVKWLLESLRLPMMSCACDYIIRLRGIRQLPPTHRHRFRGRARRSTPLASSAIRTQASQHPVAASSPKPFRAPTAPPAAMDAFMQDGDDGATLTAKMQEPTSRPQPFGLVVSQNGFARFALYFLRLYRPGPYIWPNTWTDSAASRVATRPTSTSCCTTFRTSRNRRTAGHFTAEIRELVTGLRAWRPTL